MERLKPAFTVKAGFNGSNLNSSFPKSFMFFSILETWIHIPNSLSFDKEISAYNDKTWNC